jgi:hypothetical protein
MMELFEVILLEIGEEPRRSRRMARDFQIVDMCFPVLTDGVLHERLL